MKRLQRMQFIRISLRTSLVLLTVLCIWMSVQVNRALSQRRLVNWVRQNGGEVSYEHEAAWAASDRASTANYEDFAPGSKRLRSLLGDEYFFRVTRIDLRSPNPGLNDISMLTAARHVRDLDLWRTEVTDFSPLGRLTSLEELGLVKIPVRDLSVLQRLRRLKSLNICYAENLEDISTLASLKNLRFLRLMRTQVRDLTPLANLQQLEEIRLQWMPVRDLGPLSELVRLRSLELSGTAVGATEVDRLRAALPNCRIRLK